MALHAIMPDIFEGLPGCILLKQDVNLKDNPASLTLKYFSITFLSPQTTGLQTLCTCKEFTALETISGPMPAGSPSVMAIFGFNIKSYKLPNLVYFYICF